jgi:hypothetical protein
MVWRTMVKILRIKLLYQLVWGFNNGKRKADKCAIAMVKKEAQIQNDEIKKIDRILYGESCK